MAKRIPKSGKVTINLGPSEVKAILENPQYPRKYSYGRDDQNVGAKIYKVVSEKFSNVKEDMAEEMRARDLCYGMQNSDAWKTISAGFEAENEAINKMYSELNRKKGDTMKQLVQQAFDEAGITHFKANGYGFKSVVPDDSN